jgi:hypothetical protein
VKANQLDPKGVCPYELFPHRAHLFFSGRYAADLYGLLVSDGTAKGTIRLKVTGEKSSKNGLSPYSFAALGELVLFCGVDTAGATNLWRTDGTEAGTSSVHREDNYN